MTFTPALLVFNLLNPADVAKSAWWRFDSTDIAAKVRGFDERTSNYAERDPNETIIVNYEEYCLDYVSLNACVYPLRVDFGQSIVKKIMSERLTHGMVAPLQDPSNELTGLRSGRSTPKTAKDNLVASKEIKVTILIVTFNHADYIAHAIESVLCQKTSFGVEIIVSEDASTDGTRDIVEKIAENKAGNIRLMLSEHNLHSNDVVARGLRAANGHYIALLDGDDYWTSRDKIQRQAEYLDTHLECAAVFLNAKVAKGDEVTSLSWTPHDQMKFVDIREIWCGNPFATCTSMMRASLVRGVPDWYTTFFPITDWPLYILCAEGGKLAFIDEDAAVYRLHAGGQFSPLPLQKKLDSMAVFYRQMNAALDFRYDRLAREGAAKYFSEWAMEYARRGERALAAYCVWRCLQTAGFKVGMRTLDVLRVSTTLLRGKQRQ
jgi:glycosyltransferase involved in cell wall biosynthesis